MAAYSIVGATESQVSLARTLVEELGQQHLFEGWAPEGNDTAQKLAMLAQLEALNGQYPGGLAAYVGNARRLLAASREGVNPFEGQTPSVPQGERLQSGTSEFLVAEDVGAKETDACAFVLVAGGLGERLGYNGIKLELPSEVTTSTCYLDLYCQSILAMQRRVLTSKPIPLAIMTSGDTHDKTVELLRANNNFGMAEGQIVLMKQEKVPALVDNDAKFALDDPYTVSTKPHGHGDVHMLLHSTGLAHKWHDEGRRWVVFFQDTNGVVFSAINAALGVSSMHGFDVNSLTVPRRPGEAVGGICKLTNVDGADMTINVEYNQLDPLLRATVSPEGDVPDESGFSPYPGNINVLVFKCSTLSRVLKETGGSIPEFKSQVCG